MIERLKKNGKRRKSENPLRFRYTRASHSANVGKDTVNIETNSGALGEILSFVLVHPGSNHGP